MLCAREISINLLCKSCSRKMMIKLTSGLNFINVLRADFTHADPKSAKKTVKSSSFFALSGSASIKAARRMLVKLTPENEQNCRQTWKHLWKVETEPEHGKIA